MVEEKVFMVGKIDEVNLEVWSQNHLISKLLTLAKA